MPANAQPAEEGGNAMPQCDTCGTTMIPDKLREIAMCPNPFCKDDPSTTAAEDGARETERAQAERDARPWDDACAAELRRVWLYAPATEKGEAWVAVDRLCAAQHRATLASLASSPSGAGEAERLVQEYNAAVVLMVRRADAEYADTMLVNLAEHEVDTARAAILAHVAAQAARHREAEKRADVASEMFTDVSLQLRIAEQELVKWDELRRAVAEVSGDDLETWPSHGNAPLAIAASVALYDLRLKESRQWVSDLQSGMWINCVYCGHRYGPRESTPVSMADVLTAHVEQCPAHPLAQAQAELARLRARLGDALHLMGHRGSEAPVTCVHSWGAPTTGGVTCTKCGKQEPPVFNHSGGTAT